MIGKEFESIVEVMAAFPDKSACLVYLTEMRWGNNIFSPFDETSKVYSCKNNRFYCKNTGKYFNALTGTFLENTKVSL
jgi:hypothetical protein